MRISDWSSDVCSSDLAGRRPQPVREWRPLPPYRGTRAGLRPRDAIRCRASAGHSAAWPPESLRTPAFPSGSPRRHCVCECCPYRSEEHTSELQSLMRISYAVFCLKKKTDQNYHTLSHTHTKTANHYIMLH